MADLSALKTRIASELHRSDLTTEIASAISTAITYHRSRRFEVNEQQATFVTVDGTEAYSTATIPDDIAQIDSVQATISGHKVILKPMTLQQLQSHNTNSSYKGDPSGYCWYQQEIYLTPIPNGVFTITVSYLQRKDAPANDADSSTVWTNQCEPLIRACAKRLLARDVIRDEEQEQRYARAEQEALGVLEMESRQLQDDGSRMAANW